MAEGKEINEKWLEGLTFQDHEMEMIEKDGRKLRQYKSIERPMGKGDVLDWRDLGKTAIIVTADGRKLTVAKKG